MRLDPGLRIVPTYEQLINEISDDKVRIKLPSRLYTEYFNSPVYQQLLASQRELDEHQTQVHKYVVNEHHVTHMAGQNGVTAAEMRDIMKSMPTPQPGPRGEKGDKGDPGVGRDGRDG